MYWFVLFCIVLYCFLVYFIQLYVALMILDRTTLVALFVLYHKAMYALNCTISQRLIYIQIFLNNKELFNIVKIIFIVA